MTETDQQSLLKMLKQYQSKEENHGIHGELDPIFDEERLSYEFGNVAQVDEKRDMIVLTEKNQWLEKVTYSIGLVRSVKLDEIEVEVENALNKALQLKFDSATKAGKPERGISVATKPRAELAYLYNLSYNLTVKSRVMDSPSFLWDHPHSFHELYDTICSYLDIDSRVDVVQEKLKLPTNYWTLENEHARSIFSWRLEKMIIWLILIEVIFQILAKSEFWQDLTLEQVVRYLLGWPQLPKPKPIDPNLATTPLGSEYEIVEEVIEIISPPGKKIVTKIP